MKPANNSLPGRGSSRKSSSGKEGIALITTLVVVALLVAVVVEFNRTAVAEIEISKNFSEDKRITHLAISSVNAIKDLLHLEGMGSKEDTLLEDWAKAQSLFETAGGALQEGVLEGTIVDECGKINVNSLVNEKGQFDDVQQNLWERLLKQPRFGLSSDQIEAIVHGVKDWIDKDDEVTGIFGAEDSFYRARGYGCRNGPFHTIEELLLIKGMTNEIFFGHGTREGICSYFTVFGKAEINVNTAPVPVLMAFSEQMTEDLALEMDKFRRDETNKRALSNKTWYKTIWPYGELLPEKTMTVSSDAFSVHLKVTLGESVKEIRAVISRASESEPSLLYWKEI